jgi:hypothetical protein
MTRVGVKPRGLIIHSVSTKSSNLERFGWRSSGNGDGGEAHSAHGSSKVSSYV